MLDFSALQWSWIAASAFLVGFSKMGVSGVMMLVIPVLAGVFGGKASTGLLLPILLIGDLFAVRYYNRHTKWSDILRLIPWALVGLVLGIAVGNMIDARQFKLLIALSVLLCAALLLYAEVRGEDLRVPRRLWFYALTGIASGFTSMIGNAAGPVMSLYLLAMGFRKNDFIGTYAWFFLIVNFLKVPLQMLYWHNITGQTLAAAALTIPAVAAGAFAGVKVVKKIDDKPFRYLIIAMTALAALNLFI